MFVETLAISVMLFAGETWASPQAPLAGVWTVQESTGDLPDQAVKAVDGTITGRGSELVIEQTEALVTVRRSGQDDRMLRVMVLTGPDDAGPAGIVRTRAEWRDGTLVASGHVTVKYGFLKKRVPLEERWQPRPDGSLLVTLTLDTPKGAKRRSQVLQRAKNFGPDVNVYSRSGVETPSAR